MGCAVYVLLPIVTFFSYIIMYCRFFFLLRDICGVGHEEAQFNYIVLIKMVF